MPDERRESAEQGIAPPPESAIGQAAERENREQLIRTPEEARPDSAMGGTSDAGTAGDDAWTPPPEESAR